MTDDDQLPFDGPSDDQQRQSTLDAAKTVDAADATSRASDGEGSVQDSMDPAARAFEEPAAEQRDEPLAVEERELAGESSASRTDSVETSESSPVEAAAESEPVAPARTLYFLTNRMNLNGILSSRLVAPRESFQKYYADLLQQTPGWVPLLRDAPTRAQLEAVTAERGAGAPVLVEFPFDVAGRSMSDDSVVFVHAIAFSQAVAIHLPSERDLREHRARGYGNVHAHDDLLRVTPELFGSEAGDPRALTPPGAAPAVDWRRIDRIRGAVNAAVRSARSGEQLGLAAMMVGATKLPDAVSAPPWLAWSEVDDHAAHDARPQPDGAVPDHVGFRAAYDVLGERDVAQAWSPNEVLDEVEARVRKAGLADDAAEAMIRNLSRVRSIVNVEVDFEPFRPSARALISAKALLLVLLRQELDQLVAWSDEETGADDATRMLATVLAGRLRGLSRESIELRSLQLDDLTAAWAVRVARGGSALLGKAQFGTNSRGTSLKIDGVEVATQEPLLPDLLAKYQKIAEAKKEATRIKVSRAMGWPVEYRVEVPPSASIESGDAFITIASSDEIDLKVSVDEQGFVRRLGSLASGERRRAAEAFAARR